MGADANSPACATMNGAAISGSAKCSCGDDRFLFTADGTKGCLKLANGAGIEISNGACANTDGKTVDSADCVCGLNAAGTDDGPVIDVSATEYCYVAPNTTAGAKLTVKLCDDTTAQASPSAACECGHDYTANGGTGDFSKGPDTTTSQFCYVGATGKGQMKTAAVTPAATCVATTSPAGTTAPGIFAVLAATVAAALRM